MIYVTRDLLFTHVTEIKYTYLLTYIMHDWSETAVLLGDQHHFKPST